MAKQSKEESILVRSAESLGRVIGTLQRQLDGAAKRMSGTADDVRAMLPFVGDAEESIPETGHVPVKRARRTTTAGTSASTRRGASSATKARKTASTTTATRRRKTPRAAATATPARGSARAAGRTAARKKTTKKR